MSNYWKMVELVEGEPVVYVGVHALRWQSEWGEPRVGFIQADDNTQRKLDIAIMALEYIADYDTSDLKASHALAEIKEVDTHETST